MFPRVHARVSMYVLVQLWGQAGRGCGREGVDLKENNNNNLLFPSGLRMQDDPQGLSGH